MRAAQPPDVKRADDDTAPMERYDLACLLDTMTPTQQQAITKRTRISDVAAEALKASTWDDVAAPASSRRARPSSHIAALLPPIAAVRAPVAPRLASSLSGSRTLAAR